jgi:RecJ-like exonuclease
MLLRDASCPSCHWRGEVLGVEPCPECGGPTVHDAISFRPTQTLDVRMATVMMKGAQIRKRLQGKLPWRKSSESQSD